MDADKSGERAKALLLGSLGVLLGLLAVVIPAWFHRAQARPDSVADLVEFGVTNLWLGPTLLTLFCLGLGFGCAMPRRWLMLGLSLLLFLPLHTILEIAVNPYSHTMWPIEILIYVGIGLPGVVGAGIGRLWAGGADAKPAKPGA